MSLAGDTRRRWQNSGAPQAPAVPGVRCAREQGKAALYAPAPPFTHQPPFTRQPLLYLATALLLGDRSFTWRPLLYLATAPLPSDRSFYLAAAGPDLDDPVRVGEHADV